MSEGRNSEFVIDVRLTGGLTAAQEESFHAAAKRWSRVIVGDMPAVRVGNEDIDDVVIYAQGIRIDGPEGILGRAGPVRLRYGTNIPAVGRMEFDTADLARMEADGSLQAVIVHEMAHVLGFGTIWDRLGLLLGGGTANPRFVGPTAMKECARVLGAGQAQAVPVANTGGAGTRDGHWRESVFGNELMTGFIDAGPNPLSRLTIASFQDLGYLVDLGAADEFALPSMLELAVMGVGAVTHPQGCTMCGGFEPTVLPQDAFI
jgi:hypothetical protein